MQKGNRKLPTNTLIWNLPSGKTCPKATKECVKHCYAKKAERLYPQVLPFREINYNLSKDKNFSEIIESELATTDFKQIRVHESGDLYSQSYFNKWIDIANKVKNKIVYAYTKNYSLNLSDKPKNFILIFSDDNDKFTIKKLKEKGFNGKAKVVEKDYKLKKGEFLCNMSCKECNYCYTKPNKFKRVVFHKH